VAARGVVENHAARYLDLRIVVLLELARAWVSEASAMRAGCTIVCSHSHPIARMPRLRAM
jgi:hypothetical protein